MTDIADQALEQAEIKLQQMESQPPPVKPPTRPARQPFKPFPVGSLPKTVSELIAVGAESYQCDPSFIALPMLAVLAGAIGTSRNLKVKNGWTAPSILWTCVVGESGTAKSPAFKLAMEPLFELNREFHQKNVEARKQHQQDLTLFELEMSSWKKRKDTAGPPPEKPEPPLDEQIAVSDTTVEGLTRILQGSPRGVILQRDELAGWIGGFDKYSGGGTDEPHYLSMYDGSELIVDRVALRLFVPRAYVSIAGGIQPTVLNRILGSKHRESGLAARMLMAFPPRIRRQWSDVEITTSLTSQYHALVKSLHNLEPDQSDDGAVPREMSLDADAYKLYVKFYNRHENDQCNSSGNLAAAYAKIGQVALRLALIIHCCRHVSFDEQVAELIVDAESLMCGIEIAEWFKNEAARLESCWTESSEEKELRVLAEWIVAKGGSVTPRQLQQGNRGIKSADEAESRLTAMVENGYGRWEQSKQSRGPAKRQFVLKSSQ